MPACIINSSKNQDIALHVYVLYTTVYCTRDTVGPSDALLAKQVREGDYLVRRPWWRKEKEEENCEIARS